MEDMPLTAGPVHLSRNKTERHRLQGLVRTATITDSGDDEKGKVRTFGEKVKVWMINDGKLSLRLTRKRRLMRRNESILPDLLGDPPYCWIRIVGSPLQDEG